MAVDVRPLKETSNAAIMDALRNEATNQYKYRIPSATQAGIEATAKALLEHRTHYNEFLDSLVNRIGLVIARNVNWTNPLREFKQGILEFGDTIEEIQVGLLKAHGYDPDREELEKSIFGTERPEVQANFHSVNRQDYYKVTVNEAQLRRAFLTETGLSSFTSDLMAAPSTSDSWDEFLVTCQLFPEYLSNGGFFKVHVPDVATLTSNADDAKQTLRQLRSWADTLTFLSSRYNAAHMPVFANRDELVIFTTPEFKAAVDVEALAGAFNLSHADMYGRMIVVPKERFGITGAQAIMTTKNFFVMADQRYETTSANNPVSLQNNYFLHHWQVISSSRFVPALLFWTGPGDEVTEIDPMITGINWVAVQDRTGATVTSVNRGEVYSAVADLALSNPDAGAGSVRWGVEGATSARTWISQSGVLHVSGIEGAANLTVRATTTWLDADNLMKDGVTNTVSVSVTGTAFPDWPVLEGVTGITVDGVAVPNFSPATMTYAVTVPAKDLPLTPDKVKVSGPDAGDVFVKVNGNTVTISSPASPNDPVYTVNVTGA